MVNHLRIFGAWTQLGYIGRVADSPDREAVDFDLLTRDEKGKAFKKTFRIHRRSHPAACEALGAMKAGEAVAVRVYPMRIEGRAVYGAEEVRPIDFLPIADDLRALMAA